MRCTSKVAFITDPLIWIDLQLLQVYVALNFQSYGVRLIDEMIISLKLAVAQVQGCSICKDFVKCWQINEWHKWRHGVDWFILAPWVVRGAILKICRVEHPRHSNSNRQSFGEIWLTTSLGYYDHFNPDLNATSLYADSILFLLKYKPRPSATLSGAIWHIYHDLAIWLIAPTLDQSLDLQYHFQLNQHRSFKPS